MTALKFYFEKCRFCLETINKKSFFPLHEYFEEIFTEITGKVLNSSEKLSTKVCFACNIKITQLSSTRKKFIDKQLILENLLVEKPKDKFRLVEPPLVRPIIPVLIKQEPETDLEPDPEKMVQIDFKFESVVKIEMKVEPDLNQTKAVANDDSDIEFVSEAHMEKVLVQKKRIKPKPKRQVTAKQTNCKSKKQSELIECHLCHKTFVSKNVLKDHVGGVHEKIKRFKCEVEGCDYGSYMTANLKTHKISRHNDIFKIEVRQFFCEVCGVSFTTNTDLNTHRNKVHLNIRRFGCDICGRWFYRRSELNNHMITHQKFRKLFKCNFPGCERVVSTSSLLRYHQAAVHDKIRRFQCDLCGKSFYQLIHLKSHFKGIHSKIKDLQCSICSKLFSGNFGLKQHMTIHHAADGEKPSYPCGVCGASFAYKSAVGQHMRIHKDPEFACNRCNKKYYFKKDLRDHKEKHETLAFPCTHCSRSFRSKSKLDWHLKNVHFKEKRTFRCEICTSTFTRRTTVRDHVLRQHKELEATIRDDLLIRIANMKPEEAAY